jgi:hypothetical protein
MGIWLLRAGSGKGNVGTVRTRARTVALAAKGGWLLEREEYRTKKDKDCAGDDSRHVWFSQAFGL